MPGQQEVQQEEQPLSAVISNQEEALAFFNQLALIDIENIVVENPEEVQVAEAYPDEGIEDDAINDADTTKVNIHTRRIDAHRFRHDLSELLFCKYTSCVEIEIDDDKAFHLCMNCYIIYARRTPFATHIHIEQHQTGRYDRIFRRCRTCRMFLSTVRPIELCLLCSANK